jgi:hypothetical protein
VPLEDIDGWIDCMTPGVKANLTGVCCPGIMMAGCQPARSGTGHVLLWVYACLLSLSRAELAASAPACQHLPACLPGSPYKRYDLLPTFAAVNISAEDRAINTLIPGVGETALGWSPSPGVDPSPVVAAEPTALPRRALR